MSPAVVLALSLAFAGAAPRANLVEATKVELSGRDLRIRDLARLSGFAPEDEQRMSERVLARVPAGRSVRLSRTAAAGLIRRSVPGLEVGEGAGAIEVRAPAEIAGPPSSCFALRVPIAQGRAIFADDAASVPCARDADPAGLRYDVRAGAVQAAEDLQEGRYIGRVALPVRPAVERGARMTLRSSVGPVSIERDVTALQTGRAGRRMFVRDADGEVHSASVAIEAGPGAGR